MPTTKDFLSLECSNLQSVLEETLRFKYGFEGSKDFFEEIQLRLNFIKSELSSTSETDIAGLSTVSFLLNELSKLISRIERSSIQEYSWPFVQELKSIATALCTEKTAASPSLPPEIHVLSDGGLDAYRINPERNRPSGGSRRIHTIVFPRSLKHFVLLHSILGHEVGHAMWHCSDHRHDLLNAVKPNLFFGSGVFSDEKSVAAWIYSSSAPAGIKRILAGMAAKGVKQTNFFEYVSLEAWCEEILCDFIGLLTFGPSFIAAEANLLLALDPSGAQFGVSHPPVGCRLNFLLTASNILGFDFDGYSDTTLKSAVTKFWADIETKKRTDSWFDVFTRKELEDTLNALSGVLSALPPAVYSNPSEQDLSFLVSQLEEVVPPTGFSIKADRKLNNRSMDFRHILYAGWITSVSLPDGLSFAQINQLCEQGIMQQLAVNMAIAP